MMLRKPTGLNTDQYFLGKDFKQVYKKSFCLSTSVEKVVGYVLY